MIRVIRLLLTLFGLFLGILLGLLLELFISNFKRFIMTWLKLLRVTDSRLNFNMI